MTKQHIRSLLLLIGAAVITFFYYVPVLNSGPALGIQDWDQNFAWSEFTRQSFLEYHQFPFWDPYRCGGSVHFANPQIGVLSLTTLFVVLFGTVTGIKISIFAHGLIGFLGCFLLARQQGISRYGSSLASILYSFSGITGSFLSTGMVVFINTAYTPYLLYCFLRAREHVGWSILAGLVGAVSFYFDYHIPLLLVGLLFIVSFLESLLAGKSDILASFARFIGIFVLLISPKLLLSVQLLNQFPVAPSGSSGYTIANLFYFLLSRQQSLVDGNSIRWHIDEASLYIGIIPFLLGAGYFWKNKKGLLRYRLLFLWLLVSLWLMMGDRIPVSLFGAMQNLPFMESFRVAERYRFLFIIPVALFAGLGIERLRTYVHPKRFIVIFIAICFGIYADLTVLAANNFLRLPLSIKNTEVTASRDTFSQVSQSDTFDSFSYVPGKIPDRMQYTFGFTPWSLEYPAIRQNTGIIDCYDSITSRRFAKGSDDPLYRGEWYMLSNRRTGALSFWSPQKQVFHFNKAPSDDVLIVNQNYYPGWYLVRNGEKEPAKNHDGLLAASLTPHDTEITFEFLPYRYLIDQLKGKLTD
ncbi:MAG: hypothetical protein ACOY3M_00095 [Patescibacteria group bacterium]